MTKRLGILGLVGACVLIALAFNGDSNNTNKNLISPSDHAALTKKINDLESSLSRINTKLNSSAGQKGDKGDSGTPGETGNRGLAGPKGTAGSSTASSNVALLDGTGPQTFTGNNKFTGTTLLQSATDSVNALQIMNAGGNPLLSASTQGSGGITLASLASSYNDEFNSGGPTAASKWTFSSPDSSSYNVNNSSAGKIHFTSTTANHDCWPANGINCLTLFEAAPAGNFQIDEKIDTTPGELQAPGLMVYQDSNNYLRFEYERLGGALHYFATKVIAGVGTSQMLDCAASSAPVYIRVNKNDNIWTFSYSANGTSYTTCGTIDQSINPALIGPSYNGGTGAAAYSGDIDFFRVIAADPVLNSAGYSLFKPVADSSTAFLIQTSNGNTLFTADTANKRVGVNTSSPQYSLDIAGSVGANTLTLSPNSSYTNEFNSSTNTGWSFVNGIADGSTADVNTSAPGELHFVPNPTSTNRDCWSTGAECLRYVENAPAGDFQAETKIDSTIGASQALGILVYQDATNFIRFEYDGPSTSGGTIAAHKVIASVGTPNIVACSSISGSPLYLRIKRIGNDWYLYYSLNGSSFTQCGSSFTQALTPAKIGPMLVNSSGNPFNAADFDYFRLTNSGIAAVLTVQGSSVFQNQVDSSTSFQVQNSTGTVVLGVDTANSKIYSGIGDGAVSKAFTFNSPSYVTAGAKLISIQNNGSEKFAIDKDGRIVTALVPSVRAYHSVNQSIGDNSLTVLSFNSERFDTDSLHSTSASTSRLTASVSGKYLIFANAGFAANATGVREFAIQLNGTTTYVADDIRPAISGFTAFSTLSTVYQLSAGDYIELAAYQNSGGPLNVVVLNNRSAEFGMTYLGP